MQWTPFLFLRISCDSIEYFTLNWPRWYLIVSSYFYSRKMHQYTGFFHGGSRWKIRNVALPCGHRLRKIFQSIVISDDFCNPQLVQKRFVADSFSTSLVKNVFRTPRPHSDLPFLIISFFVIFSAFPFKSQRQKYIGSLIFESFFFSFYLKLCQNECFL